MVIRGERLTAFEFLAMSAIGTLVKSAYFNRIALVSEYLSHRHVVPTHHAYTVNL
jgi:hypothetical protein